MNVERLIEFRKKANMLIESSSWLTDQMNEAMLEASMVDPEVDHDSCERVLHLLTSLEIRSKWESGQMDQLREEYRDVLNS